MISDYKIIHSLFINGALIGNMATNGKIKFSSYYFKEMKDVRLYMKIVEHLI